MPVEIAGSVLSVLAPLVSRAADEFIQAVGESAYSEAWQLLQTLRDRWSDDREASNELERFVKRPDRYASVLADILAEKLRADPALCTKLQSLLDEMGPSLHCRAGDGGDQAGCVKNCALGPRRPGAEDRRGATGLSSVRTPARISGGALGTSS